GPRLKISRRKVAVHSCEKGFERRIKEAIEEFAGLVLLRELEDVVGQVAAGQDAVQVFLQPMGRPHELHGGDPAEIAPFFLEPCDLHLGQRLELAAEAAVLGPRPGCDPLLLSPLTGEEGDDAVPVVKIEDVQDEGFGGEQVQPSQAFFMKTNSIDSGARWL